MGKDTLLLYYRPSAGWAEIDKHTVLKRPAGQVVIFSRPGACQDQRPAETGSELKLSIPQISLENHSCTKLQLYICPAANRGRFNISDINSKIHQCHAESQPLWFRVQLVMTSSTMRVAMSSSPN